MQWQSPYTSDFYFLTKTLYLKTTPNIAISYSSKSSSTTSEFNYPLIPVAATPSTKYFCKHRNTINTGINEITEAAMINPYSDEY